MPGKWKKVVKLSPVWNIPQVNRFTGNSSIMIKPQNFSNSHAI